MNIPWTQEEDAILIEKYITCKSLKEVMEFLPGRTYWAIRARANKYLKVKMKKLPTHNRNYFDTLTEENCCIAGFIAADGHVSEKGRMTINLATKDRERLEIIVKSIEYTGKIYDYVRPYKNLIVKKYGKESVYSGILKISTIQIQCPELCLKMKEHWNISTRKTRTLQPPNLSDPRLIIAYLSGLIDGDGWIVEDKSNENHTQYSIAVMGTKELMTWVKLIFDEYVPNSSGANLQPTESENIYDYKINGVKVYWLAKMFLSLPIHRFERKWGKLREFVKKVDGGNVSARFKTTVSKYRPNDNILKHFGLSEALPANNTINNSKPTTCTPLAA